MDAFYASVEIRENPSLKGKPVVVGGSPNSRGVVCAASYEARKFGVRSAIPCSMAQRLCPQAVFVSPNFSLYSSISREIHEIFHDYSDMVEPLSLDEAFIDVTENKVKNPSATLIAKEIQKKIFMKTQLTASCGVSYNKFLAKIASDWRKPNGIFVIRPEEAQPFLEQLEIGKFFGVGKVTEKKMNEDGIFIGQDLLKRSREELLIKYGKQGSFYYDIVRGIDKRLVNSSRERKSLGIEDTFSVDSNDRSYLNSQLDILVDGLIRRMEAKDIRGRSLTVKVKFSDFSVKSMTRTFSYWLEQADVIRNISRELFLQLWNNNQSLRLIGLSLGNLETDHFEDSEPSLFG